MFCIVLIFDIVLSVTKPGMLKSLTLMKMCLFSFDFVFLWYLLLFSSLISYFVYLGSLSFLPGEPGQRFVNFVYPFKEPTLGFIDFFLFFNLYFIYFLSHLYYFLPSADFSFSSSFSNSSIGEFYIQVFLDCNTPSRC